MTENIDLTSAVEDAFTVEDNSGLTERMRAFAFGNQEAISADKPATPDWGGIPVPVVKEPEGKEEKETDVKERPFFIPDVEDREKGEGGIFGNAAQAAVNGMIEGVNNTLEAAYQASRFWDDRFGGRVLPESLPDIPRPFDVPDTTVNGVISSVAQFVLPFSVAGKAMSAAKFGANVAASFPKAMKVVRPMIQGAIADFSAFDAHEKRLSNLIQNVPVLRNPVTEYLSAEDTDGQLEGRFKNAVEGLGLGALTDAFVKGVKAVRAARIAKAKAKAEGVKAVEDMFVPKINKEELSALGDVDADVIGKRTGGFSEVAPVEIDGSFFGKKKSLPELRKEAVAFYKKNLQGKKIEKEGLGIIRFSNKGLKEFSSFSADENKILALQKLEEIIKTGKVGAEEAPKHPRKDGIISFIPIYNAFSINGKVQPVEVLIAKDNRGNLFYDLFLDNKRNRRTSLQGAKSLGDSAVSDISAVKDNIAKYAESVNSDNVYINFARIDTPEDIKKVMAELAQKDASNINQARRGKMTFDKIKLNAEQEDAFKVLTAWFRLTPILCVSKASRFNVSASLRVGRFSLSI